MTRKEIIRQLRENYGFSYTDACNAVSALAEIIIQSLQRQEPVIIRKLGTLKPVRSKGRTARNISKGALIQVPPHWKVRFVISPSLKKELNR